MARLVALLFASLFLLTACQCGPVTPAGPTGFTQVYASDATYDGMHLSLVLDGDDQPMVAFMRRDTASPESFSALFTRYDGAKAAWTTPVTIAGELGQLDSNPSKQQLWLARDRKDGRLGVAFQKTEQFCGPTNGNKEQTVHVAFSTDQGATWSTSERVSEARYTRNDPVNGVEVCNTSSPRIALRDGAVHVAWAANAGEVETTTNFFRGYFYATSTGGGAWTRTLLPGGGDDARQGSAEILSLALDGDGKPAVAYVMRSVNTTTPNNVAVLFARPGGTSVRAVDSANTQNDVPQLALAFEGVKPRIAVHLQRAGATPRKWALTSDDGATFTATAVPDDGEDSGGRYIDLSYSGSKGVFSYDYSGSGTKGTCGGPKLARTSDSVRWTTCGADDKSHQFLGEYVSAELTQAGKLVAVARAVSADQASLPRFGKGIVVYREP